MSEITAARMRGIHLQTVESLRTRLSGFPCENAKCVLGWLHSGPCWLPDTDAQLDRYNEILAEARELM